MDSIKKIGRPRSLNPRPHRVTIFFSDDEIKAVDLAAKSEVLDRSEFIRRAIIIKIRGF